ncbi:MFS transporter [Gryllotalpicola ginsengisoli]|uniref:MFS transporter n=1 Tax=Gryllotalpicola ginsengisoli TaxID=444608 RepID=UPI0003B33350|nr:MFS transporter [Gryllotalpicola ginsengisoli]
MGEATSDRSFRKIWVATGFGTAGEALTEVAFPLVAVVSFHASSFATSALMAAEQVSWLVLGLFAGVLVDRVNKGRLLTIGTVGRAIVYASVPVAALLGWLTLAQLFVVAAVSGVLYVVTSVAQDAVTPELVERAQLTNANSRLSSTQTAASLVGRGISGLLVQTIGAPLAIAADAIATGTAGILYATLPAPHQVRPRRIRVSEIFAEIREGLGATFRDATIRTLVIAAATSNLLTAAQSALSILFLVRTLHVPVALTGVLLLSSSAGGLIGALACARAERRWGSGRLWRVALVAGPAVGMLVPFAWLGAGVALFAVGSFGLSLALAIVNIVSFSTRQAVCPPELRGRVSASSRFTTWGVIPIGLLLGGIIGSTFGIRTAIAAVAVAYFVPALVSRLSPLHLRADLAQTGRPRA